MDNRTEYVIKVTYLGNPKLLAGEPTVVYLRTYSDLIGTNYSNLFALNDHPCLYNSKERAEEVRAEAQRKLNEIQVSLNNLARPRRPHPNFHEFYTKVVVWDKSEYDLAKNEREALEHKDSMLKRVKEKQLFRSRMNDKPIVDDLNDYA